MNRSVLQTWHRTYRDGLLEDTLPFWMTHAVDREHGGFCFCLDRDGSILDTDKGVWHQGRFTWLLGHLYNWVEPREEWLALAEHGIAFLDAHCFDPEDGRMWFSVTREGQPIRKRRYAFSESFAAIAYAEYAKASGKDEYAEKARAAFDAFYTHDVTASFPAKYTDTRPMRGLAFPMISIVTAQVLRGAIGFDADELIDRQIADIEEYHCKPEIECVMESVGPKGEIYDHFDGRTLNPGHAIEGAWFILQEGKRRNDSRLIDLGCRMLEWTWKRGYDEEYGGILYFTDVYGKPVQEYWHDMKFWWPQNETLIATLLAYQLTGKELYAEWHQTLHDWVYAHFPDREMGEWYGYLHRDGRVSVPLKGNIWKGPFHLPRMQLVCWTILEEMLADREG
ncbi:MAG: AGE family epimerase/isomerase [Planctomycetota bacterium]|jgi:N-acylglucosamine 2-epimerase